MSYTRKRELLREMRAARQALLEAIDGLDPHVTLSAEDWRLHDVLGHIASWDREVLAAVQAFKENDTPYLVPEFDTVQEWNERQRQRKADWPPAQVRVDFTMVRLELERLLDQLDDETLAREITFPWRKRGTVYRLFEVTCVEHDREHAEMIRRWRLRQQNGHG